MNTQARHRDHDLVRGALNLDAGDTRCAVAHRRGDRAFCAGADLKERCGMRDEAWTRQHLA